MSTICSRILPRRIRRKNWKHCCPGTWSWFGPDISVRVVQVGRFKGAYHTTGLKIAGLKRLVKAQRFMIVQVFVSGRHTEHPLSGHGLQLVANQLRVPWIIENRRQTLGKTMLFIDFPK